MQPELDENARAALERVLHKLIEFKESLDAIEGWLDGEMPSGLALALRPGSHAAAGRRGPLSLSSLDAVIDAESAAEASRRRWRR